MENSSANLTVEQILAKHFPEVGVEYRKLDFGGTIHAFFLKFKDEAQLNETWRKTANAIAIYFQSKLTDEFARWNTYLFYQAGTPISRDLEYLIQNDTFSSRKIYVPDDETPEKIIEKHIINQDIELGSSKDNSEFKHNDLIWDALNGQSVKGKINKSQVASDVLARLRKNLKSIGK